MSARMIVVLYLQCSHMHAGVHVYVQGRRACAQWVPAGAGHRGQRERGEGHACTD